MKHVLITTHERTTWCRVKTDGSLHAHYQSAETAALQATYAEEYRRDICGKCIDAIIYSLQKNRGTDD